MDQEFLTDTVGEWFENLDYEFMILHLIICYGLYYSENMRWIVEKFSPVRRKGRSRATWLIGAILAALDMFRYVVFLEGFELITQKMVAIFHSFVLIQVFVDPMVESVHKWLNLFKTRENL